MFTEGTGTIFIAMGLVFVLLLGEIDLSAGYAAGVSAAVMARLMVGYNAPWPVSIGGALVTGLVIGLLIGWLRAKVRIPSFVVTLALFLSFQGVMLYIVNNGPGQHGNITLTDNVVLAFANSQMPIWAGWLLGALVIAGYTANKLLEIRSRRKQGLRAEPLPVLLAKIGSLAAVTIVLIIILNQDRSINQQPIPTNVNGHIVFRKPPAVEGVPWVVPVLLVLFVLWTVLLGRTRYGRHVYAVGGNEEASRRAGIPVDRIRISVFVLCSFMAAVGGIMIASNVSSVSVANYGGNTLLLAVGAAVIGGTSLFGGRGRMVDALVGGAVVEVIYNGMAWSKGRTAPRSSSSPRAWPCCSRRLPTPCPVVALVRRGWLERLVTNHLSPTRPDAIRRHNLAAMLSGRRSFPNWRECFPRELGPWRRLTVCDDRRHVRRRRSGNICRPATVEEAQVSDTPAVWATSL